MIPKDIIDKIFETSNIEEVISDFVQLKKRGVNMLGLCPFHNEKTPSFTVSPSKGIYKCFGCGKGGNSVNFIMDHEHYNYPEALRYLAKKYNIEFEEEELTSEQIEKSNDKNNLFVLSDFANNYYQTHLWDNHEGGIYALTYLKERGYTEDIIKLFELGYSLKQKNAFTKNSLKSSFEEKYLLDSGLSINSKSTLIDRFNERIIFPIHSFTGRILGFGGRALNKNAKAKYLNSPESLIYHKSKILYGIYFAKQAISKEDNCFLVEGYTDVITLYQKNIKNVVSSSGTALTKSQIKLIRRFTKNITLLFDSDPAGIKASFRSINLILSQGMHVRLILFPDKEDPDSYAKKLSSTEISDFLKSESQDFITFKTKILNEGIQNDPIKRVSVIKDVVESISIIPDYLIRMEYAKICSKILDIKEEYLLTQLNEERRGLIKKTLSEKKLSKTTEEVITPSSSRLQKLELELLRIIFNYGNNSIRFEQKEINVVDFITYELNIDKIEIRTQLYKDIFNGIQKQISTMGGFDANFFIQHANPKFNQLAADLVSKKHSISLNWQKKHNIFTATESDKIKKTCEKTILKLKLLYVSKKIEDIQSLLKNKEENIDLNMLSSLIEIKKTIHDKLNV
ncbi:MAG: DNA primase [Bacteroidota bacterium]|nr:DNA primase [Bacteroidota bacterium]